MEWDTPNVVVVVVVVVAVAVVIVVVVVVAVVVVAAAAARSGASIELYLLMFQLCQIICSAFVDVSVNAHIENWKVDTQTLPNMHQYQYL